MNPAGRRWAVEAAELAREAEASDIGAGTLENIDLAMNRNLGLGRAGAAEDRSIRDNSG